MTLPGEGRIVGIKTSNQIRNAEQQPTLMSDHQPRDDKSGPPGDRVSFGDRMAAWRAGFAGPRIRGVRSQPVPHIPGSQARGRQLMAGNLQFGGSLVEIGDDLPWRIAAPNEAFLEALHGFDWLDDLVAIPDGAGHETAQRWLIGWLERHGRGGGAGWSADLVGRRQLRLVAHALVLLDGMAAPEQKRFFDALSRQTGLLSQRWQTAPRGLPRFEALTGLIYSACALTGAESHLRAGLRGLAGECARDIDGSGGILSRNPEELLEIFTHLTGVAAMLRHAGKAPDPTIDMAIKRAAPILRSLRHSDGGLVRMHGGGRGAKGRLDAALAASGVRPAHVRGLAMGYARLGKGRLSLIVDAAAPMLGPGSQNAHASTLAMELTSGREPVIVSAGSGARFGASWRRAGRATASHSTLSLLGYASARLAKGGLRAPPERQDLARGPATVDAQTSDMKTAEGLTLSHDGWRSTHGLVHLRSLQLDHDGSLLRGEDGLAAITETDRDRLDRVFARLPRGEEGLRYSVHFHLHPDTKAKIDMGGTAVSVQLANGETWVFRYVGKARLTLEKGFYLDGARLRPRATKQIVLSATLSGYGSVLSWSLARPVGLLSAPTPETDADI